MDPCGKQYINDLIIVAVSFLLHCDYFFCFNVVVYFCSIADDDSTARDGVDDTPASTIDTAHVVDDTPTCTADMVPEDIAPEDEVVVKVVIAPKKRRKMISAKPNLANKKFKPDR